jgi:hypothetical protein
MVASSIALFIAGVACLFVPVETLSLLGFSGASEVSGQIFGALYLGFASANWTARGSMIGGIYARPLSMANCVHFFVGATVLIKGIPTGALNVAYICVTLAYLVFAVVFAFLVFGRPGCIDNRDSD